VQIEISEAGLGDAAEIAEIHLTAQREAMPYLRSAHTDDETRNWFARVVGDRPAAWWVARADGQFVGYMAIDGENLDHLYVRPGWQRRGVGLSLLHKAKALSPRRLELWTFQRITEARGLLRGTGAPRRGMHGRAQRRERAGCEIRVGPA
jgi:GNAT superfamily N-acetyltransferase